MPWASGSVGEQGLATGWEAVGSSCFREFESSLVCELKFFQEFRFLGELREICKIRKFGVLRLLLRDWL